MNYPEPPAAELYVRKASAARARTLLSVDGRDVVAGMAAACAARVARLVELASPGGRARAQVLVESEVGLHALVSAIDEVLDLEHALAARQRISL